MKRSKLNIFIFTIIVFIVGCKNNQVDFFPPRHESLTVKQYNKFSDKLARAYNNNDYYEIGFQLVNLEASNQLAYSYFEKAIIEDSDNCQSVFSMENLAVNEGFYMTPYKADTIRFKMILDLCLQNLGQDAYQLYLAKENSKTQQYLASLPSIDSSRMISSLINSLEKIDAKDQIFRKKSADFRLSESEIKRLHFLMNKQDSLNLISIDSILAIHSYPTYHEVGHDLDNTTFIVLHHQSDLVARERYLSKYRDYFSQGQIDMFMRRTAEIEDSL